MATPREIFEKDHGANLRVHRIYNFICGEGRTIEIIANISFLFEAGVKFASLYIEATDRAASVIRDFIEDTDKIYAIENDTMVQSTFMGTEEIISSSTLLVSPRLLVYTPTYIPKEIQAELHSIARNRGVSLVIRDGAYLKQRIDIENPLAFISHDSRDKDNLVRELATKLHSMMCTVWYDEYALIPGSSLRESIEEGLKKCKKCVVVLSPNFLSNEGWTKAEFDSIYTREIIEKSRAIIPIWHNVTPKQVYDYCPRLADRVGINSNQPMDEIAKQVMKGLNA